MSLINPITAAQSTQGALRDAGAQISKSIGNVDGIVHKVSNLLGANGPSFFKQLKRASYRGVEFFTLGGNVRFGRRNALHEYPFRDDPWVEDLGRQAREITITAFLVGDDVIAQRDALISACEQPGDGVLVHPSLGTMNGSLMTVSSSERWERGRYFEIEFHFIRQGGRQFPDASTSSADAIAAAAVTTQAATIKLFGVTLNAVPGIGSIASQISDTVDSVATQAIGAVNSATSLLNIASSLQGNFGRLLGQASGIPFSNIVSGATDIQTLIGAGAAARESVTSAVAALVSAGTTIVPATFDVFSSAATALVAAVKAASFTPADALRSLVALTALPATDTPAQGATADLFRRAAVCALAQASGDYQPSTAEEAAAVRTQALMSIDNEITIAGDQGDDTVYTALRALRATVIADMNAKGAQLPTLVTVATNTPMPSLVLAQKLYRDPNREDELTRRANPIHPAFMPTSFSALSS